LAHLIDHENTKLKETKMRKVMFPAASIVSLGLMLACSNALRQGESPRSAETKTAATEPYSAKGSVEVKLILAQEGMMQQVADAYREVLNKVTPR
jgi:hypothetical protein